MFTYSELLYCFTLLAGPSELERLEQNYHKENDQSIESIRDQIKALNSMPGIEEFDEKDFFGQTEVKFGGNNGWLSQGPQDQPYQPYSSGSGYREVLSQPPRNWRQLAFRRRPRINKQYRNLGANKLN